MSTRKILDREAFENFLANAVAVQKSGLDTRSLSAVVEIQQFMATDRDVFDQAMQKIADRLFELFHASGTAIALLDSNELVYRAGAGNAAKILGRRIAAVLNVGSSPDGRAEILRVENATTDTRIEAEICRQFGAVSLLMLPICRNSVLAGVLEVRFDEAHSFSPREMRVCRLMIGALEDEMVRRLRRNEDRVTAGASQPAPCEQPSSHLVPQPVECAVEPTTIPVAVVENKISHEHVTNGNARPSYRPVVIGELGSLWANLRMAMSSGASTTWNSNFWRVGAVLSAAALMGILICVSHVTRPSPATNSVPAPGALTGQTAPAKPLAANDKSYAVTDAHPQSIGRNSGFRRVQISPNEVDYIAEDVTIRRFTISPAKPKPRSGVGVKEVEFGDDVTVRYFAKVAPPLPQHSNTQMPPGAKRPTPSSQ